MYTPNSSLHRYDDMLSLPRPVQRHAAMTMRQRAMQFATVGMLGPNPYLSRVYRDIIIKKELDEAETARVGMQIKALSDYLRANPRTYPYVFAQYFVPDELTAGGYVLEYEGNAYQVDSVSRRIRFTDETAIPFEDLYELSGDVIPTAPELP